MFCVKNVGLSSYDKFDIKVSVLQKFYVPCQDISRFADLRFKITFLASMPKKLKRKQPTLAAFGFTKKVVHRGEEVAVNMPLETIEVLIRCDHCEKLFKSEQGLSFHKKVMHGSSNNSSVTISQPTKPNNDELLSLAVEDVVNSCQQSC